MKFNQFNEWTPSNLKKKLFAIWERFKKTENKTNSAAEGKHVDNPGPLRSSKYFNKHPDIQGRPAGLEQVNTLCGIRAVRKE